MQKQKSAGKSPLLNGGKPKLEEVKVAKVDDLVAQMEAANAAAVRELNEPRHHKHDERRCCSFGCDCPPCLAGRCDLHGAGPDWRMYDNRDPRTGLRDRSDYRIERDIYGNTYRVPVTYDDRYDDYDRRLAYEWMRYGGNWDDRRNRPEIRDEQEYRRWREFEYRFEREFGRSRRRDEEERYRQEMLRRRMMEMDRQSFYVPMNIDWKKDWE